MATNIKRHGIKNIHTAGIFSDMTVDGPKIGTLTVVVNRAKNLPDRKTIGKQNPYCAARLGKEAKRTETDHRGGQTPKCSWTYMVTVWRNQELHYTVHDSPDYYQLTVSVFNEDKRTDLIGETRIDLKEILIPGGGQNTLWHNLKCKGKYAGEVRAEITYTDTRPGQEKTAKTNQISFPDNIQASSLHLPSNKSIQKPPELYTYTESENTNGKSPITGQSPIKCQDQESRRRDHRQSLSKNHSCSFTEKNDSKFPQLKTSKCAKNSQNAICSGSNGVLPEISGVVSTSLPQQLPDGQHDELERQLQEKKSRRATHHRGLKNPRSLQNYTPYEIPSIENLGILPDLGESPPPPPIHGCSTLRSHNNSSRAPAVFSIQASRSDTDSGSKIQSHGSSYKTSPTADLQPLLESYSRRGCYQTNNIIQNQSYYQSLGSDNSQESSPQLHKLGKIYHKGYI
ncbi:putative c2 domain containing protein [Golovinomyces cichoracearum]|uniref:Putative c2 domain containing protein n=1 Tax=Golovinomyces cichoracearum TaxID=62708 RepID=A0A420IW11_9PEZI|nr:putative c2 domain containing protein [Golovinomyces cichoracearum]